MKEKELKLHPEVITKEDLQMVLDNVHLEIKNHNIGIIVGVAIKLGIESAMDNAPARPLMPQTVAELDPSVPDGTHPPK